MDDSGLLVPVGPAYLKRNYIDGEVGNHATMEGLYQLTVRRADGSIKQQTPWFKNLILDQGLNRMGSGGGAGVCEIGTGTTPPSVGQGALQAFSARTTNQQNLTYSTPAPPDYVVASTVTYRFAIGALNGNYTEVGIGWANSTLFSRALITPDGVNPAAITVLPDEQLDVSYQIQCYTPTTDWGGTYTISGASYDLIGRRANAGNNTLISYGHPLWNAITPLIAGGYTAYSGTLGAITSAPSGTIATATIGPANAAYSNNSMTRQATITFGLTNMNLAGGIRSISMNGSVGTSHQYQFTPAIPKDNTKTLSLTFSCSWARRP
jgi:hypothetical protein